MNPIFDQLYNYINVTINCCCDISHSAFYQEKKTHSDYDIWYILAGEVTITLNNNKYTASKDDVIFFYPNVSYESAILEGYCEFIYIHFDFSIGKKLNALDNYNFSGIIRKELLTKVSETFKDIYFQYKNSDYQANYLIKASFSLLLATILDLPENSGAYRTFFPNNIKESTTDRFDLQSVLQYIEENLNKNIRIIDLANMINTSEKYFITLFKRNVGVPPLQYVNELRMNRAKKLLYIGSYSIKQIANILGYPDPYSFSKAFKKKYGIAPNKFKEQCQSLS
ncbi:AraC family transcriptional regulator [Clostridium manihotivorum]|uniref:AraC family transcriptional regulator n=1 Tax=Clostridium manihotivorum TaxID=2320868 RepID=A0A3R5U9K0_9CLOT|nr:AraC family transcriptional regulator [Clostridium manihotivorum]QAA32883.1 AraC family transcriptional regulator [Clostridium manihotivorum]